MHSTHEGELSALAMLPKEARRVHLFPKMTQALISVPVLCDHGCTATFDALQVRIERNGKVLLAGKRNETTRLWDLDIGRQTVTATFGNHIAHEDAANAVVPHSAAQHAAFSAIARETMPDRLQFLHAALGSPVLSTLTKAIDAGYLATFGPELTSSNLRKHLPPSEATAKGHLDQVRKNIRSTRKTRSNKPILVKGDMETIAELLPTTAEERCNFVYADAMDISGRQYADLPGAFLVPSVEGYKYLLIVYNYDGNAILAEPMKSRTASEHVRAYKTIHAELVRSGLKPKLQLMDNEASGALKEYLDTENVDFQLVPAGMHRRNAAERAIRTFKNHFIAILCGTDPAFPLELWAKLIQQALLTLNLLRASRINPRLSAYSQMYGVFDFNKTPIAPLGTKVIVHEKPANRGTWAPHGVDGWYIGPAMEHYRCYRVWITDSRHERVADTLAWFPKHVPMPKTSSADALTTSLQEIAHHLRNPTPASPFAPVADQHRQALNQLAELFDTRGAEFQQKLHGGTPPRVAAVPAPPVQQAAAQPRVDTSADATPSYDKLVRKVRKRKPKAHPRRTPRPRTDAQRKRRNQQKKAKHKESELEQVESEFRGAGYGHRYGTRSKSSATRGAAIATGHQANLATAELCQATIVGLGPSIHSPPDAFRHVANAVLDPESGATLDLRQLRAGKDKLIWDKATANEFGRLTQGIRNVKGTDTMFFIPWADLPEDRRRDITYYRPVCAIRPNKEETHRVRITMGGDRVNYPGEVSTPTSDLSTAKLHINSTISTKGARYMTMDISNFYLGTPMERYEYARIPIRDIPEEIIAKYNLRAIVDHNGFVLVEVRKGMYGLPQAGRLAHERLVQHLGKDGYRPCRYTPGLWKHDTRPISFTLVVDDFGVKYVGKEHAEHLFDSLSKLYNVTTDWTGSHFLGLQLDWDYENRWVDLSMPGYVPQALHKFQHPLPPRPEDSPHPAPYRKFGPESHLAPPPDESARLDAAAVNRIQQIIGTLLYYARAVDPTMLVALSSLSSQQAQATTSTAQRLTQLLNYAATHPDATIRYHASDMILYAHSDASYLSEPKARSRVGGHFFLSNKSSPDDKQPNPALNGPVHTVSSIVRQVMSSAGEAEVGALYFNCKDAMMLRTALDEMGHPQPATPVQTDNSFASGFANKQIKQRRSKAIDMRFYWVQDRVDQGQFKIHWAKGTDNLADYFTKHFNGKYHRHVRKNYLLDLHRRDYEQ